MLFLLSLICLVFAQSEILVTAPRIAQDHSVKVISEKELIRMQNATVVDVLKKEAGIDVAREGLGGQGSVFIRGGESGHTLVLVDGIEANDPSDPTRRFNLTLLNVKDVERIEIIKGARSVYYGSDAIAGVINIITKKNLEPGEKFFSFNQEFASFRTSRTQVKSGHRPMESTQFQLNGYHEETKGYSVAKYPNGDDDGFFRDGVGALVKTEIKGHTVEGRYDYSKLRQDLDAGASTDDINSKMKTGSHRTAFIYKGVIGEETFFPSLKLSQTKYKRDFHDPVDPLNTFGSSSITSGEADKLDLDLATCEFLGNKFNLGGELDQENMKIDSPDPASIMPTQKMRGDAFFASDEFRLDELKLNAGVRHDRSNLVRSATTYRMGANFDLTKGISLNSNYGTGFKSPSMYQFFAPVYGNSALKPEEARSVDGGVRFKNKTIDATATYFQNDFENLIIYNAAKTRENYENLNLAHIHGLENSFKMKMTDDSELTAAYTWMRTRDRKSGKELPARAKEKASLGFSYFFEKHTPSIEILMMGRRRNSSSNDLTNAGYTLINTNLSYKLKNTMDLNFRIDNLLDKQYVEFIGFNTLKRSYTLGFRWFFD